MKLILLAIENLLAIPNSLPFYIPMTAVGMTMGAFTILFLFVSFFTSRMVKMGQLIELFKSEEKPKPEPKASLVLSLLAVFFILAGYVMVFIFVLERMFSFMLLFGGVASVILGTYFLFTQLSVYAIRMMKRSEGLFFRRTNVLTISELAHRMKDNAAMFFMVAVVSAVAFTGIGTVLALGDPGLTAMEDPNAFTYQVNGQNNLEAAEQYQLETAEEHIKLIEQQLRDNEFAYTKLMLNLKDSGYSLLSLSEYNAIAKVRGLEVISELAANEVVLTPSFYSQQNMWLNPDNWPQVIEIDHKEEKSASFQVKKVVNEIVLPYAGGTITVVSDETFEAVPAAISSWVLFDVPDWKHTKAVARILTDQINTVVLEDGVRYEERRLHALVQTWISNKQQNGILFIVSSMVGIVFFTFAASFLYFRLYTDLERDQRQYQLIGKLGFTQRELSMVVTRQLLLMFFLPILVALVHAAVAFTALQLLLSYSVLFNSVMIFVSFVLIQILYFFVIRWRYLRHMQAAMQ